MLAITGPDFLDVGCMDPDSWTPTSPTQWATSRNLGNPALQLVAMLLQGTDPPFRPPPAAGA